ncbi:MAG: tyrosine-type recombinase/integrase [Candidatus Humimicrobiaceae bacterium]
MIKNDNSFFKHLKGFLTVYLPKQKCCSKNTIKSYRETLNLLRIFIQTEKNIPFVKITFDILGYDLICQFLDWLKDKRKCSAATRNQRLAVINSFLSYAAMQDPALMSFCVKVKKIPLQKTGPQRVEYMGQTALKTVIEQPNVTKKNGFRDRFFMILLYDTGARVQEILDLKLKDFQLGSSTPFVYLTGKGSKTRAVPLMGKTIKHLNGYLARFHSDGTGDNEQYLFYTTINSCKKRMSEENVSSFMKRYGESARRACPDVPTRVYPHLFRHSRSMHLYQMGIPLSYIKDFLGHSNINTTSIYASADITMMKNALENVSKKDATGKIEIPVWQGDEDMILTLCGLK